MKKRFALFYLLMLTTTLVFSQQKNSSLSLTGGVTGKKALGFMVNYTYTNNNANYEFALLHSMFKEDKIQSINYSTTTLNIGYLQTILRNTNNSISMNIGAGVIGGYESVPTENNVVLKSESGFVAGAYGAFQIDFYISDSITILLRAQQNYLAITTTGELYPYIAGGLKFNL